MAGGGLDTFLTIAIPTGIILWLGFSIYGKLSERHPHWFTDLKEWINEKTAQKSIKIDPMRQGSIQYYP
jgi:hypothetical protein